NRCPLHGFTSVLNQTANGVPPRRALPRVSRGARPGCRRPRLHAVEAFAAPTPATPSNSRPGQEVRAGQPPAQGPEPQGRGGQKAQSYGGQHDGADEGESPATLLHHLPTTPPARDHAAIVAGRSAPGHRPIAPRPPCGRNSLADFDRDPWKAKPCIL